jgi:inactivated superfamily I helicase
MVQRNIELEEKITSLKKQLKKVNNKILENNIILKAHKKDILILNKRYTEVKKELLLFKTKNHITFESSKPRRRWSV